MDLEKEFNDLSDSDGNKEKLDEKDSLDDWENEL